MTDPEDRKPTARDVDEDRETPGGQPQEEVDDRPAVSTVEPDDYPQDRPDR